MAEKYTTYTFSYQYAGKTFCVDVVADDVDEAWGRLRAMPSAKLDGELMLSIPVPGEGIVRRFMKWLGF